MVTDASGNVASDRFELTVTPVNDPPTLDPISDLTLNQNSKPQTLLLTGISAGAANEHQTLTVTALSSDPAVIPNPTLDYSSPASFALLTLAPAPNATGTATITVTVDDGEATDHQVVQTFTVTVNAVNELPTISTIDDQITLQDTARMVSFVIGDLETAADDLILSAASSDVAVIPNENIVFDGTGSERTVTLTPAAGQVGMTTISVTVADTDGGSTTGEFLLVVERVNGAPTISSIADTSTVENFQATLNFTINDDDTPADSLLLSGESSNPALVPNANLSFGGSGSDRTITLVSTAHQSGSATITLSVLDDRGLMASTSFELTVTPTNDPPSLTHLPDVTMRANTSLSLPIAVADLETPAADLSLSGESSAPALIADANLVFGGSGANRNLTLTPIANQTGSADITVTVTDGNGGSATDKFKLTVIASGTPPRITLNPQSQTNWAGGQVLFNVLATGTPPVRYQWRFNGIALPGQTNATLVLTHLQGGQSGQYDAVASDEFGSATSESATLTVHVPPYIVSQPVSQNRAIGSNAEFDVIAGGDEPLTYQWWFNGTALSGATGASLTVANAQAVNEGSYFVVITNRYGTVTSHTATLTLGVPPSIVTAPASLIVTQDHDATFSMTATGDEPLTYRWFFDQTLLVETSVPNYTVPNAQPVQAGDYHVVVANHIAAVTSSVATLTVLVPPSISLQPASQSVAEGTDFILNVTARGTPPLTYQWQLAGANLADDGRVTGTTTGSLSVSGAVAEDAGSYIVVVSNGAGAVTSVVAIVSVITTPSVTCPPAKTVECGEPWDFDVPLFSDEVVFDSLVFDNSVNDSMVRFNPGTNEVGDEIILDGAARYLTSFIFEYWGTNSSQADFEGTIQARVRFYGHDGPLTDSGFPSPGTVLYDSGSFAVHATTRSTLIIQDFQLDAVVPLTDPVPDNFTWSVQFTGMSANDAVGLDLYSPPVVGLDFTDYWERDESGWQLKTNEVAAMDFSARIDAAHSPVTVTVVDTVTNATCGTTFLATRTWQMTDPSGLDNLCAQTVTVLDQTPPAILCVPDKTVACGESWDFDAPTAMDTCGTATIAEMGTATNAVSNEGRSITRTWSASDDCGNTATCAQTVTLRIPPVITAQPADVTAAAGADVALSMTASGTAPLSYQWYFNDTTEIAGATGPVLTLTSVPSAKVGNYTVAVANECGSVTSAVATLTVTVPPTIGQQPNSQIVTQGQTATLEVIAAGNEPLDYQWWFNGNLLPGATSATLNIANVQAANAGAYVVTVANAEGFVVSDTVSLEVGVPPTITVQPRSQAAIAGDIVRFSVTASGTAPLTYQWQFNAVDIPNATSASLTLYNVQLADAGNYSVQVQNAFGTVASSSALLTVTGDTTGGDATLVEAGAVWKYRDTGVDLGTAWRGTGYDDTTWSAGPAQLGYGDGDEATVVDYGPDANNKYITTYFRRTFVVDNPAQFTGLEFALLRDDGAVVYLNGTEVFRSNMPGGTINADTLASSLIAPANENDWVTNLVDPGSLVAGLNLLAVELHQGSANNPDLSFDLRLRGLGTGPATPLSLSAIPNQTMLEDTPLQVRFTLAGSRIDPALLTLSATSGNAALVANSNLLFDGNGTNRTLTIVPAADQWGTAQIDLSVMMAWTRRTSASP